MTGNNEDTTSISDSYSVHVQFDSATIRNGLTVGLPYCMGLS
jgi:hypothetical protein